MKQLVELLRDFNVISVIVRMVLAVLCGGIIGIERETKRRPAGFRTHTLVCLGAAMTMLTSQFLMTEGWTTDPARLGAQVVAGIGFIGAGTIIVTRRQKVKGLTTAAGLWVSAIIGLAIGVGYYEAALITMAGLWVSAIIGLAIGVGYYEAALITMVIVLIAEILLSKLEWHISSKAKKLNVYIEYNENERIGEIAEEIKKMGVSIMDIEITRSREAEGEMMSAIFALHLDRRTKRPQLLTEIQSIKGVLSIEEL